jgi:hypothetical protein
MAIRLLVLGDVVGRPGRQVLASKLGPLVKQRQVDFVIANAENVAGGSGITQNLFHKLRSYGVDVITLGDHVYKRIDIVPTLAASERIIRPANLSNQAAGRPFTLEEERPASGAAVAIVGYSYWRQHGLTPDVIGRSIVISGRPFTIVGVAPEGFNGTMPVIAPELFLPFGAASLITERPDGSNRIADDRAALTLLLAGTLKEGTSIEAGELRLAALASAFEAAYPQFNQNQRLIVHPRSRVSMGPSPRSDTGPAAGAVVLMAIAGLVLLVACLNLANILLARGAMRRQEIAIRLALGGGRARIVRQLLVEGVLVRSLSVHPGELATVEYEVVNVRGAPVTGQAVPSYGPQRAGEYFQKLDCFCFTQQTLAAGETRRMPVTFVVDPKLPKDLNAIALSYTFFEVEGRGGRS